MLIVDPLGMALKWYIPFALQNEFKHKAGKDGQKMAKKAELQKNAKKVFRNTTFVFERRWASLGDSVYTPETIPKEAKTNRTFS